MALYDFPASQPGDLEMKEGDLVYLTKLVNDSWMEGRVGNREGMFPVNFVDVKIPLPGVETNVVNALYAFKAETSDDLTFDVSVQKLDDVILIYRMVMFNVWLFLDLTGRSEDKGFSEDIRRMAVWRMRR